MVYSLVRSVSIYNNNNLRASALPRIISYFNWYD